MTMQIYLNFLCHLRHPSSSPHLSPPLSQQTICKFIQNAEKMTKKENLPLLDTQKRFFSVFAILLRNQFKYKIHSNAFFLTCRIYFSFFFHFFPRTKKIIVGRNLNMRNLIWEGNIEWKYVKLNSHGITNRVWEGWLWGCVKFTMPGTSIWV